MRRLGRHFRARLIGGVLLLIPLAFTSLVLKGLWDALQASLRPLSGRVPGPVSGIALDILAILILIVLLYLAGVLGRTLEGGRAMALWEGIMDRIPIVRPIYRIARQTTQVFAGGMELQTTRIVLLEYPRPGVLSLGLVTGQYIDLEDHSFLTVYIPTVPNPSSGFLAIVQQEQVVETDLTYEDAMKIVISAGVLTEEVVRSRRAPPDP